MSNAKKIQLTVSIPEEAYTLIRAAGCIYGLGPKAYLKMVATQCALGDLERLGRVIDAVGDEDDNTDDEAADFENCPCLCDEETADAEPSCCTQAECCGECQEVCPKADTCECKADKKEKCRKDKKQKKD